MLALLLLLLLAPGVARAEEGEQDEDLTIPEGVDAWLSEIAWADWEREWARMPEEVRRLWNGLDVREITRETAQTGDTGTAVLEALLSREGLAGLLTEQIKAAGATALLLMGVLLTGSVTAALTEGKDERVAETAGLACRCFLLLIMFGTFLTLAKTAAACISSVSNFMELASPALMTLLTALGGTASAGVFQPAMALLCTTVTETVVGVIVPLTLCGGVIGVIDKLSPGMRIGELSALLKGVSKWTVGALTTLYLGATAIRGMTAASFDGVSLRAARYAAGAAVPMFGGLVTGAFDTMLGCAALVKNALGVTAILLCAGMIALPMLKLLGFQLMLRLTAAVAQPLSGSAQAGMLRAGADMIGGLLSACAAVSVMFIVTVGLVTGLGNAGYL